MKPILLVLAVLCGAAMACAAEPNFSAVVRPDDFAAAGLQKLTPEELARLDALVRAYQSGELVKAQRELEAARLQAEQAEAKARQVAAEAQARVAESEQRAAEQEKLAAETARQAAEKEKKLSLLERAKVILKPGTQVEYTTLDARLATEFRGWRKGTLFTLDNGQQWRVVEGEYVTPPMPPMPVRISPGMLGTFWMSLEGIRQKVKVEAVHR